MTTPDDSPVVGRKDGDVSAMKGSPDMEFLRQEYFHLQSMVESFDEKALTIKAWSVTLSMVGVGAAFIRHEPILLLLAAGASLLFWFIEAVWKSFQQANYYRLRKIEAYMRGKEHHNFSSPDITGAWSVGWSQTRLAKIIFWPHVFLPHAVVVLFGVACWLADLQHHFVTP